MDRLLGAAGAVARLAALYILALLWNPTIGSAQTAGPMPTIPFQNLGNRVDGTVAWCPNCVNSNPCLGGGAGAYALRGNSTWNCASNSGGGAGTVTLVGLQMPAVFSVTPGSIISAGTFVVTANGTSGGVVVFDSATTMASTAAGLSNQVIHGGAVPVWGAVVLADIDPAALSGNGSKIVTLAGAVVNGHCASWDASGNIVDNGATCGGGGGGGSVTSVGQSLTGLPFLAVGGSPITGAGTLAISVSGATSGGVIYANSTTSLAVSALLGQNLIVLGGGAGAGPTTLANSAGILHSGTPPSWGAVVLADISSAAQSGAGTGNKIATTLGTLVDNDCVKFSGGNLVDAGAPCGSGGGGGGSFSAISSGINIIAAMVVGNGASLTATGTGVITANSFSGVLPGANGGTGNGFMQFTGPATSIKTYTLPNSSTTILTTLNTITVPQGGTGITGGTSGGFPCFDTGSTMTSSGLMTANMIIKGAGVGLCPTASGVSIDGSNNLTTTGTLQAGQGGATISAILWGTPVTFSALAGLADTNGTMRWCSDCTSPSNPAAGSGTGAFVARQNSTWVGLGSGATAAFGSVSSGTNTTASMICGSGCSITPSGTGIITATQLPTLGTTTTLLHGNASGSPNYSQLVMADITSSILSNPAGTKIATSSGTLTTGHCVQLDGSGNYVDAGAACGTGSGGGGGGGIAGTTYSGTVNFSSVINDGACDTKTFTATGLAVNTALVPTWPTTWAYSGTMVASAANTVSVILCNNTGAPVTPGSLSVAASTLSNVGPGACDPATMFCWKEEFFANSNRGAGLVGDYLWETSSVGAAITNYAFVTGHPGVLAVTTTNSANTNFARADTGSSYNGFDINGQTFDSYIGAKLTNTATAVMRFGYTATFTSGTAMNSGCYFEASSSNWNAVCKSGGTNTTTSCATATDSNWHRFRIFATAAGSIQFSIDGSACATISTNVPTAGVEPFVGLQNSSTVAEGAFYDYFVLNVTSLTR